MKLNLDRLHDMYLNPSKYNSRRSGHTTKMIYEVLGELDLRTKETDFDSDIWILSPTHSRSDSVKSMFNEIHKDYFGYYPREVKRDLLITNKSNVFFGINKDFNRVYGRDILVYKD